MISSQRLWPLDHEAGQRLKSKELEKSPTIDQSVKTRGFYFRNEMLTKSYERWSRTTMQTFQAYRLPHGPPGSTLTTLQLFRTVHKVFCAILMINSYWFPTQYYWIDLYNGSAMCSLRSTNWFLYNANCWSSIGYGRRSEMWKSKKEQLSSRT